MPFTRYALGIVLLLLVAVLWVSSSFLIQYIFGAVHYDKPLFLTYVSTSFFSLYLLPTLYRWCCCRNKTRISSDAAVTLLNEEEDITNYRKEKTSHGAPTFEYTHPEASDVTPTTPARSVGSRVKEYALNIMQFGILWLLANYLFNLALDRTSVASNSILSALSSVFTLFLVTYFGMEKMSWLKFLYVLLNFVGVVLVTCSDSTSRGRRTLVGDTLSVLSALFYSFYVLFLQVKLLKSSPFDIFELFGWMGLFMLLSTPPVILLWNFFGIEKFVLPSYQSFVYLTVNALIGTVLSDYLWALAVVFTSPVLATMALSLTIPLSTMLDTLRGDTLFSLTYLLGAFCVFSGFIGLAWENRKEEFSREETPPQV